MTHTDISTLAVRVAADPDDPLRRVEHETLTDARVLIGPDVHGAGLVSLIVLSDGHPVGYDLQPGRAGDLAVDLRLLAAEAQAALLDPAARQPLADGQQLERYIAHIRRTAVAAEPGQGGWLVARLPFADRGPEPLVLLGAGPTLVLNPVQALVLAGALDVQATSVARSAADVSVPAGDGQGAGQIGSGPSRSVPATTGRRSTTTRPTSASPTGTRSTSSTRSGLATAAPRGWSRTGRRARTACCTASPRLAGDSVTAAVRSGPRAGPWTTSRGSHPATSESTRTARGGRDAARPWTSP